MTALQQYRNIQRSAVVGRTVLTTSNPPSMFNSKDAESFLQNTLDGGAVVHPGAAKSDLYIIVMPPGVRYEEDLWGEHTYFRYQEKGSSSPARSLRYTWVMNDGTLDFITSILSHELVEACSDPEGDAFQITPRDATSWNEIADSGCEGKNVRLKQSDVLVQKYWSEADSACVAPGA